MFKARYLIFAAVAILQSCGHTNKLKDYSLKNQRMTFRSRWTGTFTAEASIYTPVHNPMAHAAATIGGIAASAAATDKLEHAAKPDLLATSVASGIEDVLRTYLAVVPVHDSVGESVAIVETEVREFSLNSRESGIYAKVSANMRMLSRATGKVIWEDCESVSVPLRAGVHGGFDPMGIAGIINAAQLADLPEAEVSRALVYAAEDAGRELGETLREDIADLH